MDALARDVIVPIATKAEPSGTAGTPFVAGLQRICAG
jgi:hypothetical protein